MTVREGGKLMPKRQAEEAIEANMVPARKDSSSPHWRTLTSGLRSAVREE
jgi:hypothetical protein